MISALFSFTGRLNRAPFWGYSILAIAVALVVQSVVMSTVLGPTIAVIIDQVQKGGKPDVQELIGMFTSMAPRIGWLAIVLQVIFAYPFAALCVKRRHDRNKSGNDVLIYIGLGILVSVLTLLGIGMTTTEVRGIVVPTPESWMQLVQLLLFIFGVYLFIVLCFLKGTVGENAYGPDPLQG